MRVVCELSESEKMTKWKRDGVRAATIALEVWVVFDLILAKLKPLHNDYSNLCLN